MNESPNLFKEVESSLTSANRNQKGAKVSFKRKKVLLRNFRKSIIRKREKLKPNSKKISK